MNAGVPCSPNITPRKGHHRILPCDNSPASGPAGIWVWRSRASASGTSSIGTRDCQTISWLERASLCAYMVGGATVSSSVHSRLTHLNLKAGAVSRKQAAQAWLLVGKVKRCSPVDGSRIAMAPSSNLCKEPLKIVLRVVRKRQCPHNWCHLITEIRAPAPEPPDDGCRFRRVPWDAEGTLAVSLLPRWASLVRVEMFSREARSRWP